MTRMCTLIAAFSIGMVGVVRHGFYKIELRRKENLTRYTTCLACQLMVGECWHSLA